MSIWSAEIKELEKLYESIKGQLPDLVKELERLIKADDENMILLYSRRCLEVIITDLCECELKRPRKTEPLKGIIDKLQKEEKVPSHIITSMHGLNELSTYGAHPKDFDPEQVKPVLNNLAIIIRWYLKYKQIVTIDKAEVDEEKIRLRKEPLVEVTIKERTEVREKPAKAGKRKLISIVTIVAILIIAAILAYPKIFRRDTLEKLRSSGGRISLAIMPFKNLTVDTLLNIWQLGLQNLLITSLSNSEELSVRQYETLDKILGGTENANYASLTPSFAADLAKKLEANTVIIGNLYKTGNRIRVTANLIDSKTEEIYKSYEIDGNTEDDFFHITDSLSKLIMNFLEMKKLVQKNNFADLKNIYTSSASALKYYIQARRYHGQLDYNSAIDLYKKSISMDTNFVSPMLMLSYIYGDLGKSEESKKWVYKAYDRINNVPHDIQLQIKEVKAAVNKEPKELIKYVKQYLEINPYSTRALYAIGWASYNTEQWQAAIDAFEEGIKLNKKFGSKYKLWIWNYILLGNAYHKIGEHDKEMKIYEDGLNLWPDQNLDVTYYQSVCAISQGDSIKANVYLGKVKTIGKQKGLQESEILGLLAGIYDEANSMNKAEKYYRQALLLQPSNPVRMNGLAYFLIDNDRNIEEGLELIDKALELSPEEYYMLDTKGWGLYKQGRYDEALEFLNKSWDSSPFYNHETFLHLEAAKKAVASQKNN
jgi:tetratricopeptide (TPR) repeat protein